MSVSHKVSLKFVAIIKNGPVFPCPILNIYKGGTNSHEIIAFIAMFNISLGCILMAVT